MNVAVIFAGGVGRRMHTGSVPKQFLQLQGKPIIIHTLEVFQHSANVDAICIACLADYIDYMGQLCAKYCITKVRWIVPGGATSQESTFNGLQAVYDDCGPDTVVMIHDGVRPNITSDLIDRNIASVKAFGNGISCSRATETPAQVDDNGSLVDISERSHAVIAKAPQSFWLKDIYQAHLTLREEGGMEFIDSASMLRYLGYTLHMVECPWDNIKITSPSDYYIFRAILEAKENSQIFGL